MTTRIKALIGVLVVAAIGAGAYTVLLKWRATQAREALIQRTRDTLVFVEGGNFTMGNYETQYRAADGTVKTGWVADSQSSTTKAATLDSYYVSAYETSTADFNIYLAAHDYPQLEAYVVTRTNLPDHGAEISFEEATKYCAWLGEQAGITMRLPTEAEWEYAARSRGRKPIWPTDNGGYDLGRNVPHKGYDYDDVERDPPLGVFPPNPLGLYDLEGGLYEWVSDREPTDPEGSAISKGGSNHSSSYHERTPDRGVSERWTKHLLKVFFSFTSVSDADKQRILRQDDPLSPPGIDETTARCVAVDTRPPSQSGFGQMPGPINLTPPYSGMPASTLHIY